MGGDAEHVAFLARVLGYCLTGDTGEEKLFVILGPGATGKSTLIEAFKRALGDYALTADFETFISAKGGIRNDVARLAGARFVSSIEVEKGRRLAEGLVKSITGGDDVTARFLYREAFTFRPAFKLALVANDAPRADDNDTGLWRRIVKVPFEHVVPKEKRDPRVKADLCDAAISGPAILAWALAGCIEWQKTGLAIPASIERATEDYRASQDPLRDFFDEALVFDVGAKAARAALSRRYESWCKANAVRHPVAPKAFAERLRARGAIDGKSNGSRVWNGVGLVEDATEWPSAQGHEGTPGTPRDPRGVPASRPRNETRNDAQGHEGHQIQTTLPCTSTRGDFSKDVTLRDPGDPAGGFQAPARFRRRSAS